MSKYAWLLTEKGRITISLPCYSQVQKSVTSASIFYKVFLELRWYMCLVLCSKFARLFNDVCYQSGLPILWMTSKNKIIYWVSWQYLSICRFLFHSFVRSHRWWFSKKKLINSELVHVLAQANWFILFHYCIIFKVNCTWIDCLTFRLVS